MASHYRTRDARTYMLYIAWRRFSWTPMYSASMLEFLSLFVLTLGDSVFLTNHASCRMLKLTWHLPARKQNHCAGLSGQDNVSLCDMPPHVLGHHPPYRSSHCQWSSISLGDESSSSTHCGAHYCGGSANTLCCCRAQRPFEWTAGNYDAETNS